MNAEITTITENRALGISFTADLNTTLSGRSQLGGKGESLVQLSRIGMPVPDAFIVTADAFALFLSHNAISSPLSVEEIKGGEFPERVRQEIEAGMNRLDATSFAVRSSAIAEDGESASFAGQYTTLLNCSSIEEVLNGVVECWASVASVEAKIYGQDRIGKGEEGMAVIIQKMVPADAAGVIFTANPVTGNREHLVINAVKGLGDRLVSGEVTPEELILEKKNFSSHPTNSTILSTEEIQVLAEQALHIEQEFNAPQDIEWAIAQGELFILQARPITTLSDVQPIPIEIEVPSEGRWELDTVYMTRPLSPLFASTYIPMYNKSTRIGFSEFGTLIDGVEMGR